MKFFKSGFLEITESSSSGSKINPKLKLKLSEIPTLVKPEYSSDESYFEILEDCHKKLADYQELLYAGQAKGLLVIFQGMDTAGKDGAIKHVLAGVNPQGCKVVSFKNPSATELNHDFLWRINQGLPARGTIGIFNRSHYEDVLITHVHPELLRSQKFLAREKLDDQFWHRRYHDITNYEKYLRHQGYEVVKIFLHISKAEQMRRLLARFDDPGKSWKISKSDVKERIFWKKYQTAYELCLQNTSTKKCPWYLVPADDKRNARLLISQILISRLKSMKLAPPTLSEEEEKQLKVLKRDLRKE